MLFLDFEFCNINKKKVTLVCCCMHNDVTKESLSFWLHNDLDQQNKLKAYLEKNEFETFVAYSAVAECRSFISLGLNPMMFDWIDLFLEWRCLTNHNNNLIVGDHLLDGKIKYIPIPKMKWDRAEEDKAYKLKHNLAEATFRLLGERRDTDHKDEMRDLIISAPNEFTEQQRRDILNYCMEDVVHLPRLYSRMVEEYTSLLYEEDRETLFNEMLYRGKYAALTSIRESRGYPMDLEKTRNLAGNIPLVLDDCKREINSLFPDIKPFKWSRLEQKFTENQSAIREYLEKEFGSKWPRTSPTKSHPQGQISLDSQSWENKFNYTHDYPKDVFGAQIVRYKKLVTALSGFKLKSKTKTFWECVGDDNRVRPYLNIYGAQSGRSQPAATGFLFLKPAWCRALMVPPKGKAIVSIDYGSEEFLVSALMSKDQNMIESYLSGDVYLNFAKLTGMAPKDATKETHKYERNLSKSTVLGLSYRMGALKLSEKLSQDMRKEITVEEAEELIEKFYSAYPDLSEYQSNLIHEYKNGDLKYIKLSDGWIMWGDNPNPKSVTNVPIQGESSCIMRRADFLCYEAGLYAPFTLHDAIYIEIDETDLGAIDTFIECMREGFASSFPDQREVASKIKMDVYAWSTSYEKDSELTTPKGNKIECSNLYIDSRAEKEFNQFSKYFEKETLDL